MWNERPQIRQIYLITYSMVDRECFPTRSSFADAVVQSFADTPAKVLQWCCCLEQHVQSGVHFHMAMKLDKNQRWLPSKRYLLERCGISVHFSATHENYFSAWKYVMKEDQDYIQWRASWPYECNCSKNHQGLFYQKDHSHGKKRERCVVNGQLWGAYWCPNKHKEKNDGEKKREQEDSKK